MMAAEAPTFDDREIIVDTSVDDLRGHLDRMKSGGVIGADYTITTSTTEDTRTTNTSFNISGGLNKGTKVVIRNDSCTEIDWSMFPVRRIETRHVISYASKTHSADQMSEELVKAKREELEMVRKQIREYARKYIQLFFLQGFKEICQRKRLNELLRKVQSMGDILEYHKRHCDTVECQEIIGYMLYGYFDARKGWELNLEEQWMEEKNWKYADMVGEKQKGEVSNWNKGSIAKIISETKETQVKRIRMAGKGKEVKLFKRRATVNGAKQVRRKMGEFHVLKLNTPAVQEEGRSEKSVESVLKRAALDEGLSYEQYTSLFQRFHNIMNGELKETARDEFDNYNTNDEASEFTEV